MTYVVARTNFAKKACSRHEHILVFGPSIKLRQLLLFHSFEPIIVLRATTFYIAIRSIIQYYGYGTKIYYTVLELRQYILLYSIVGLRQYNL